MDLTFPSIEKEIYDLKINKVSQSLDIPTKIIKDNMLIYFAEYLWKGINSSIKSSPFNSCLQLVAVTPLHKKDEKDKKDL